MPTDIAFFFFFTSVISDNKKSNLVQIGNLYILFQMSLSPYLFVFPL